MNNITVVIPTSYIKSHPSTEIIEETLSTVRHHLKDCPIIITFDGIRAEQEDKKPDYLSYIRKMLWRIQNKYDNIMPLVLKQHLHQSGMMKEALKHIDTELIMYVEHDTPLTPDRDIEWKAVEDMVLSGKANTVRLHHENVIPVDHEPLLIGVDNQFTMTYQWSQRPHVSSKVYYEYMMSQFDDAPTFIEDVWHGVVANDYLKDKMLGWYKHRLWIYTPDGGIQRSYHLDGRAGERKFTADDEAFGLNS